MMAKRFLHLNGVTFELAYPMDAGQVTNLVNRLAMPSQPTERQQVDVTINGAQASLSVHPDRLWSVAGWIDEA